MLPIFLFVDEIFCFVANVINFAAPYNFPHDTHLRTLYATAGYYLHFRHPWCVCCLCVGPGLSLCDSDQLPLSHCVLPDSGAGTDSNITLAIWGDKVSFDSLDLWSCGKSVLLRNKIRSRSEKAQGVGSSLVLTACWLA